MTVLDKAKYNMQKYCCPIPGKEESEDPSEKAGKGEKEKGTAAMTTTTNLSASSKSAHYFSNYFYSPGYRGRISLGRQFEYCEEAAAIFQRFAGTSVRFGDVRRFVLEETAFPVHAEAFKLMRRDGRITKFEKVRIKQKKKSEIEDEREGMEGVDEEDEDHDEGGEEGVDDNGDDCDGTEEDDDEEEGEEKKKKEPSFYANNLPANHWSSKVWTPA